VSSLLNSGQLPFGGSAGLFVISFYQFFAIFGFHLAPQKETERKGGYGYGYGKQRHG